MSLSHRKFHWLVGMDINTNINHYYILLCYLSDIKNKTKNPNHAYLSTQLLYLGLGN